MSWDVVAPALIPRKPRERVKTNCRDARKLVELGRAGLLTAVQPPTPEDDAVRDLAPARDDAREDLQRCRHRLGKLLLRRGLHFSGRNWTRAHRRWIDGLEWEHAAECAVIDDYLLAIDHFEQLHRDERWIAADIVARAFSLLTPAENTDNTTGGSYFLLHSAAFAGLPHAW